MENSFVYQIRVSKYESDYRIPSRHLCADVTDIADGASAKIKIVEKDNDGNDDFVADLSASVQEVSVIQLLSLMILETAGVSLSALKKSLMIKFMKKSLL